MATVAIFLTVGNFDAPTIPADIIAQPTRWNIALPVSEIIASGDPGGPYAGNQLKYSNATADDIRQSEAREITPNFGTFSDPDYFYVAQAPDGAYEVRFIAPTWGSTSSPFSASDHTRSELRCVFPGPSDTPPSSSRGNFKLADRMKLVGVFRCLRFPDLPGTGTVPSSNGDNITVMQIHPISDGASSTFVILLLRRNGELQATMRNADNTNAASSPWNVPIILLSGVSINDVIWYECITESDRIEWRAENRTQSPGTIVTLTQTVPNVAGAGGLTQRTRFQYAKAGCYHGTNPNDSGDIANVVNGVLAKNLVTDFVGVAYRELSMEYLT